MTKPTKINPAQVLISQVLAGVAPDAALANATADLAVNSVAAVVDGNAAILAMLANLNANVEASRAETARIQARMDAAPVRVKTVKVTPDGQTVVSSGKRGKPPTAGLDDCRDADGKVRKIGVRAYSSETSGDRVSTFSLASRGAIGHGKGETISKSAACPYTDSQVSLINAASSLLPECYGLRFKLVAVTPSTVKIVPARLLTEVQAESVASILAKGGMDVDAWTRLRTTVDGTGDGELNATEDDGEELSDAEA